MTNKSKNSITAIVITILILSVVLFLLIQYITAGRGGPRDKLRQIKQLRIIGIGLEFFNNDLHSNPPSGSLDGAGQPYCGAMKLCEAIMGRDLLGFHPDSVFRADGMDSTNTRQLYPINPPPDPENLKARMGTLLQFETAKPNRLLDIYGSGNTGSFNEFNFVLCDVFTRDMGTGQKTGMPILYYKANTSHTEHDVNNPDNTENIYDYKDNHALVGLGVPWKSGAKHPLFTKPTIFYEMTKNRNVSAGSKPNREDSYILISAGKDGLYGTADDICNFEWKYIEIENPSKNVD